MKLISDKEIQIALNKVFDDEGDFFLGRSAAQAQLEADKKELWDNLSAFANSKLTSAKLAENLGVSLIDLKRALDKLIDEFMQAEKERVVEEIEKLLNKIIWFSDNTPCISEEKERGCFRCTAEEIELWWQSLKNKILGGEL